jgi:uncharacterized protein (DUF1330 family)
MVTYVVVQAKIKDPEKLGVYAKTASETMAAHGGKVSARANALETMAGNGDWDRFIMIEFPDADAARNWYQSPAYQAIIPLRDEAADTVFTLAEA